MGEASDWYNYILGSISKKNEWSHAINASNGCSIGVKNIYDPKENVFAGAKYFGYLLNRFDGDFEISLASYNAVSRKVIQYGGIPPYKETHNFVVNHLLTIS